MMDDRTKGRLKKNYDDTDVRKQLLDPKRVLQILECRRKVLNFVESMLEPDITVDTLKSGEELISRSDYDNIVQERFLLRICGYPLCSNQLIKEWRQRYHVSLKDRKIYDVEVRKLYCSVRCMDTSIGYRDEFLPVQPIWMRLDHIRMGPKDINSADQNKHDK